MKRWLFENFWLKTLSLLIASALWAYVGSRQFLERRVPLHLELSDIPAGMSVDPNVKTTVSVVFSGRKDVVLDQDANEFHAVMSLRSIAPSAKDLIAHPQIKVEPAVPGVAFTVPDIPVHLIPMPRLKNGRR